MRHNLFSRAGRKIAKGEPFSLDTPLTYFEGGNVQLFTQKKGKARYFLAELKRGFLFESPEIFAIAETDLTVFKGSLEILDALEDPEELAAGIEEWATALLHLFSKPIPETKHETLLPGQILEVEEGNFIAGRKPTWIEVVEGEGLLFGKEESNLLPGKESALLLPHFWLLAKVPSRFSGIDSLTLVQRGMWKSALQFLSRFTASALPHYLAEREQKEETLLKDRFNEEEANLSVAISEMDEVLTPHFLSPYHGKNELHKALYTIGVQQKIHFVFTKAIERKTSIEEKLRLISEASLVQKRRVKLKGKWWKQDHGPLLGFYGPEERPIPLLNTSGSYRLGGLKPEEFAPYAYMFYPPFPPDLKTGFQVLKFWLERSFSSWISLALFSVIGSLFAFFPAIATKLLFTYAIPESQPSLIAYLSTGLLGIAAAFSCFYFFRDSFFLKIEGFGVHLIQSALWDRLLKLSPSFFSKFTVGNLFWRLSTIEEIRDLFSGGGVTFLLTGLFSVFYLFIMAYYSPLLALSAFFFALISLLITMICSIIKTPLIRQSMEIQGNIRGSLIQMITGIRKLRAAGVERGAFAYWADLFAKSKTLQTRAQTIQNIATLAATVLPILSTCFVYLIIIEHLKTLLLPDFLAFNVAFSSFIVSQYPLNITLIQLANAFPLWERARVILEEPEEVQEGKPPLQKFSGEINISQLVFSYDSSIAPTIDHVSLVAHPQELIAIVGPSGSGKSTLLRLLLGFEKPHSGAIYFDGKNLDHLDLRSVRKQIGAVIQGEDIMAGKIFDNLTLGGFYTKEQIKEAIHLSGFEEDLKNFPMGINTWLQAKGTTLSGGQKQRLLLARALLANPSLLILDEATSALDNRSEKSVMDNIEELNITRIVIAQKLSTIKKADRIYVLEQGKIVQTGTFQELAEIPGLFNEMLIRQKF